MTDAERVLWQAFRNSQLGVTFRRQHPIPPFVVDFACVAAKLVVEADGGQHATPGEHDRRDAILRSHGWRVLRFWNSDILDNPDGALQIIATALPTVSPPRGRVLAG